MVLGLLVIQYRYRGQYPEGVRGQENHLGGMTGPRHRLDDVVDVVNRVGNPGILGDGAVGKIDFTLFVHDHVFEQRVAADGLVDIRFAFRVQVYGLGVAAALEIEHAIVIPAVLIVPHQAALGIGGQGGFTGAGQAEKDGHVLFFTDIGGAVHGGHILQGQVVVHHREHALFHFAAVPGAGDDLHFLGHVEDREDLGVEAVRLPVGIAGLGAVEDHEVGLTVVGQFFLGGPDKHVLDEVSLPGHLHYEAHLQAAVLVGTAKSVHHEQAFRGQLVRNQFLEYLPVFRGNRLVVIGGFRTVPPDMLATDVVQDNKLVLGGAAGKDTGVHIHRTQFGDDTLFISLQVGTGLLGEELLVGGVVDDFGSVGYTVAA